MIPLPPSYGTPYLHDATVLERAKLKLYVPTSDAVTAHQNSKFGVAAYAQYSEWNELILIGEWVWSLVWLLDVNRWVWSVADSG